MNSQSQAAFHWPRGLLNQFMLLLNLGLFLIAASSLTGLVFFGQRLFLSPPAILDLLVRLAAFLFFLYLLHNVPIRRRYPLLLLAALLFSLAALTLRIAVFFPSLARYLLELCYAMLLVLASATSAIGLLRRERWDRLLFGLPLQLLGRRIQPADPEAEPSSPPNLQT